MLRSVVLFDLPMRSWINTTDRVYILLTVLLKGAKVVQHMFQQVIDSGMWLVIPEKKAGRTDAIHESQ
jgi:hypothetical protein